MSNSTTQTSADTNVTPSEFHFNTSVANPLTLNQELPMNSPANMEIVLFKSALMFLLFLSISSSYGVFVPTSHTSRNHHHSG